MKETKNKTNIINRNKKLIIDWLEPIESKCVDLDPPNKMTSLEFINN